MQRRRETLSQRRDLRKGCLPRRDQKTLATDFGEQKYGHSSDRSSSICSDPFVLVTSKDAAPACGNESQSFSRMFRYSSFFRTFRRHSLALLYGFSMTLTGSVCGGERKLLLPEKLSDTYPNSRESISRCCVTRRLRLGSGIGEFSPGEGSSRQERTPGT